jgi:parvulin-like peptidyl-prolyl isomerase
MRKHALAVVSVLMLVAVVATFVVACGGDVPQGAIATVGDNVVTQEQFDKIIKQAKAQAKAQGQEFPAAGTAEYNQYAAQVVEYLVSQEVIEQAAADPEFLKQALAEALKIDEEQLDTRLGKKAAAYDRPIEVTQKTVDKRVNELVKAYGGKKKVAEILKQQGMTWKDLDEAIRDQIVGQRVYDRVIAAARVSPEAIKKYYEKNKDQFDQPETRAMRHILVKTEAQAKKVQALLEADPSDANWKKVAKEYSIDPGSKDSGGSLGDVTPGMMVPAFDKAGFALEVNEMSVPVKSQFGWHVIEVTKITPAKKSTLKGATKQIRQTLLAEKQQALWEKWLKQAQIIADVQYAVGYNPKELLKATPTAKPTKSGSPSPDASVSPEASPSAETESPEPSPSASE